MTARYAAMTFRESTNLGDYVQAIAAERFLPQVDCLVDRDHLTSFDGPKTKIIMNGWFMQRPEHWPPPTNIDPLLISVHLTHNHDAYRIMLQPSALDYFHEHGPVGCRDLHTLELLSDAGVDAYFSGCLTLTLEKDPAWKPRRDLVLFVNAFDDERPYRKARKRLRVAGRLGRPRVPTCALRDYVGDETREILAPELLRDGLVVSNNDAIEMNPLRRYAMARQLLELFATARVVVTTKLHCALPCLAYGTPVIFIDPQHRREWRFDGLLPLLRTVTRQQFLEEHASWDWDNPLPNPASIEELAGALRNRCQQFVADSGARNG